MRQQNISYVMKANKSFIERWRFDLIVHFLFHTSQKKIHTSVKMSKMKSRSKKNYRKKEGEEEKEKEKTNLK